MSKAIACRWIRLKAVLLIATSVAACSDASAPVAPTLSPDKARATMEISDLQDGGVFSARDAEGRLFTLRILDNEIILPDGDIILMDPEVTAHAATGFHSIVDGDAMIPPLSNLPSSGGGDTCPDGCPEPTSTTLDSVPPVLIEYVGTDSSRRHRGSSFGAWPRIQRRGGPTGGRANGSDGVQIYSVDPRCDEIKRAAEALMPRYRQTRASFLGWLWQLKWSLSGEIVNGKWVRKLPNGAMLSGELMELAYENRSAWLEMKILAGMWVASYCGTVVWPTSSSTGGGGGGSGWGDFAYVCHYEWWQMSVSGGPWEMTEVRVCDYEWQWHVTYLIPHGSFQGRPSQRFHLPRDVPLADWRLLLA